MSDPQDEPREPHSKHPPGRRRVLQVLGPSSGGIRRHVRYLAANPPEGYETAAVAGPGDLAGFFDGLRFLPTNEKSSPVVKILPDVVHAHGLTAGAQALRWTVLGAKGPPVVVTVHTSMQQTLRASSRSAGVPLAQRAMWQGARLALRRVAALIAVSDEVRSQVGFGDVVPPALDLPVAEPGARAKVRQELGTPEDRLVILAVGRLHPDKQLDVFIRSVEGTGAEGWIAGEGPERQTLEALAGGSGVRLLGHRPDVGNLLAAADVFALPAHAESYGFAVMEAVSAGLPVIATRTGAILELVGDAGVLVSPDDAEGFRAVVREVVESPEMRQRLSLAARQRGLPTPRELVARIGVIYDRVVR